MLQNFKGYYLFIGLSFLWVGLEDNKKMGGSNENNPGLFVPSNLQGNFFSPYDQ